MKITYILILTSILVMGTTGSKIVKSKVSTDHKKLKAEKNPPNFIFILTDDQRWDALGAYGNSIIQTPHLDRLAEQGVLFENMFVTTSICAPNRASIMTGQYVSKHQVHDFSTSLTREQLQESYMGQLKKAGYIVGFIGKWGVGEPPPNGFLDYDRTFRGQGRYFIEYEGEKRHLTSVMGDQALEFLDQFSSSEAPFALSISFKAPHVLPGRHNYYNVSVNQHPFDLELKNLYKNKIIPKPETADPVYHEQLPEFLKNSENRKRWAVRFWSPDRYQFTVKSYYRQITGVDNQVGRILGKLEEKELDKNTIIIFSSDNGFFLGEYGFAGKWLPYEPSIRVPLIVYSPYLDSSRSGARINEMALSIDIAPTILSLAGLPVPDNMQGKDLTPLLQGVQTDWRSEFFYEHDYNHPLIPPTEAVRTERWKYIRYIDQEPVYEELYDLKNDPLEKHNLMLSEGYQRIKEMMRKKWDQWHMKIK